MGGGLSIPPPPPVRPAARPYPTRGIAAEALPAVNDDMAEDEALAPHSMSLTHFGTTQDTREEDDRFKLDNHNEEDEEEEDEEEEYDEYEEDDENV